MTTVYVGRGGRVDGCMSGCMGCRSSGMSLGVVGPHGFGARAFVQFTIQTTRITI